MPITEKEFEGIKSVGDLLRDNPNRAYYMKEIAEKLGLNKATVTYHVSNLLEDGKIKTKWGGRKKFVIWDEGEE